MQHTHDEVCVRKDGCLSGVLVVLSMGREQHSSHYRAKFGHF